MFELNGKGKDIVEKFAAFGLSEYEARTFFALQVLGKTTARPLWMSSGVPQAKIYNVVYCLALKGLAEMSGDRPKEIEAKPFLRFANDYLTQRKCILREMDELIEHYREEVRKNSKFVRVVI
ncbi:MAG TPA: helix-turn-helix domain-containing protein [Candidatus Nitrosotalea sp.]|nr:helix-turn-helix domain-containing protein [Candidatus Nitrosotalea sp.]